jgi:flavin-dependent dehydrogenase
VRCAALVGADGANGVVSRLTSIPVDHVFDVALEGNIGYDDFPEDRIARRMVVELSQPAGGYGWLFPKGDHANVGVWGSDSAGPRLRDHLSGFCARHGVSRDQVENLRGHRLPLRRASAPAASGRTLLVGDAAGLVDPLSGDGMYEAFVSSRLAADAILDLLEGRASGLEPYTTRLNETLAPGASAAWGAKRVAARYPRVAFAIARLPVAWSAVDRILRGDLTDPGEERGLSRLALKTVERIARAAESHAA